MPEYPDVELYLHALRGRVVGEVLRAVRVVGPFVLRTVTPSLATAAGRRVVGVSRMGKRIVFSLEGDLHLVVHLMIAGRFRWRAAGTKVPAKVGLAAFDFDAGTLLLTEASPKKRAALHVVAGEAGLQALSAGGADVFALDVHGFQTLLTLETHTLKRALTDPRLFSGIGNAYSDEILHRARLSPFKLTAKLSRDEIARLLAATTTVLAEWRARLIEETGDAWPEKVTAFRPGMAVHGRYGQPCPVCGTKVQRVVYAENEMNYCPVCQTEGRLLADRSLSRLLKSDWPKTLEELEALKRGHGKPAGG